MAWQEGAERIKTVGKFLTLIGSTIVVLVWLSFFAARGGFGLVELLLMLITPVTFGGIVWALGWILEGYNQPPRSHDES
jgi:multisubunit Na+/H+ antiporter MnhG subunit